MSDPSLNVIAVQIGAGTALSGQVNIGVQSLVGIIVPSIWTPAGISFRASADGGSTWFELQDITGAALSVSSIGSSVSGESVGTGNGVATTFAHTAAKTPIVPGTLTITAGAVTGTDNGAGAITGPESPPVP